MERVKRLMPWACGLSLLLVVGLLVAACAGLSWLRSTVKPRGTYLAVVDRVEPEIPGLVVKETGAVVGAIEVINNTGQDVYFFDKMGNEILKITTTEVLIKNKQGQWVRERSVNRAELGDPPVTDISYHDTIAPRGEYNGQVMKTWEVHGRVGDTPFTIYGRTVYYTRLPTPTP